MKLSRKVEDPTEIEIAITKAHEALTKETPGTDSYEKILKNLSALYDMQKTLPSKDVLTKDTIAGGVFSIANVLSILLFEKVGNGIISTKSMSLIPKIRVR